MTDNATAAAHQNRALLAMLLENNAFRCPLSNAPLSDPVLLKGTGLSYNRVAIENHLRASPTDPETGRPLSVDERQLLPNPAMRDLIRGMIRQVQMSAHLESEAAGPVSETTERVTE